MPTTITTPITEPVTGIRFLWVPGGCFNRGSADWPDAPVYQTVISPFWLAETPVTNAQYAVYLTVAKVEEPAYWRDRRFSDARQPVVGVDWDEAMAFCVWLSRQQELKARSLGAGLPTEAQWEFAARGTDGWRYPWGNEVPDQTRACYGLGSKGQPAPVGSYPAGKGPFGHLDLAGNVWEWCLDWYDPEAYRRSPRRDPVVLDPTEYRVVRGGSWDLDAGSLRCAYRSWGRPGSRSGNLGLRVACSDLNRHPLP